MQENEAIEFVINLFDQVWSELKLEAVSEFYDKTVIGYFGNQAIGFQDITNRVAFLKNNFAAMRSTIQDIVVEKDKIAVCVNQTLIEKDSNKQHFFKAIAVYKMQNKKIVGIQICTDSQMDYFQRS